MTSCDDPESKIVSTMATRDEIVAHIRRLAQADGATPGRQRFETEAGIKRHEWYGLYWARWSDALQEAGLASNILQGALERESVLRAYIELIKELGRAPSEGDIRLARRSTSSFPSHSALSKHIGLQRQRLEAALRYANDNGLDRDLMAILHDAVSALPPEKKDADLEEEGGASTTYGFVYLMKSGRYYKIGKTNSPDRRQYEIGLRLAEGIEPIHSIETDDPSGIEAYWHNRFKEKRMNGEWFNLSASDVRAFRLRKKFM